eukprot:SAG31_NODE_35135_length_326_cov_0.594714_1_plen_78_part_10
MGIHGGIVGSGRNNYCNRSNLNLVAPPQLSGTERALSQQEKGSRRHHSATERLECAARRRAEYLGDSLDLLQWCHFRP